MVSTRTLSALELLENSQALPLEPVYVVFGNEEFLRTEAIAAIRRVVLDKEDELLGLSRLDGKSAVLADVLDELATVPFFGQRRLVLLLDADDFVSAHRAALERYMEKPHRSGVLLLAVESWRSNTRLARLVPQVGVQIDCRSPDPRQLAPWCRLWARGRYGKQLGADAAELLVELVAGGMGQLEREIDKLACYVGQRGSISVEDVDRLVAAGRVEAVWKIIDSAAAGDARSALNLLDSLILSGEYPVALLGAISAQLRRLAKAHRLLKSGQSVRSALSKAGIRGFFADQAQAQLRHLGPTRLEKLYDWLLQTDLGLKGDSSLPPQHLLERLVIEVAAQSG